MLHNADVDEVIARASRLLSTAEYAGNPEGVVLVRNNDPMRHHVKDLRRMGRPNTLPRIGSNVPVLAPLVIFLKRILRRLLRWMFEPVFQQQKRFNMRLVAVTAQVSAEHEKLRFEHEALQLEVAELRHQVEQMRGTNDSKGSLA